MKRCYFALIIVFVATTALIAAEFWNSKPYTKWSDAEVERMRTDSPWAKSVVLSTGTVSRRGGVQAVNDSQIEPRITYVVSIRSALPLRQANVRMRALIEKYDKMDQS